MILRIVKFFQQSRLRLFFFIISERLEELPRFTTLTRGIGVSIECKGKSFFETGKVIQTNFTIFYNQGI